MAKRWYVIHTYSGYENKVKADLEHRIETYGPHRPASLISRFPRRRSPRSRTAASARPRSPRSCPSYVLVAHGGRRRHVVLSSATRPASPALWAPTASRRRLRAQRVQQDHAPQRRAAARPLPSPSAPPPTSRSASPSAWCPVLSPISTARSPRSMPEAGKVKVTLMIFGRETPVELTLRAGER